jgi:hypothetical protein
LKRYSGDFAHHYFAHHYSLTSKVVQRYLRKKGVAWAVQAVGRVGVVSSLDKVVGW